MKIIFLNVWNFEVKEDIEKFFVEQLLDTDVFCLQEAYEKTKGLCKDILRDFVLISDYKYVNPGDDFSSATYIRKNVEIVNSEPLLKNIPEVGLALHTQIRYKNTPINICNVHGISKPGDKKDNEGRINQSQELIKAYQGLDGLKIIGGDFNLEYGTKSVAFFEESGYINLIKKYKISTTRNRLCWDKYPDSKQHFSDFVFVNQDLPAEEFTVPNIEVSDHLPLILKISL